jgi:hypothetical protein
MTHIETIPMRANDDHDRARLERAVIEAAKAWAKTNYRDPFLLEGIENDLSDACDALLEFEEQQKQ